MNSVPHYDLEDVRNAAKNGTVRYRGRKVFNDVNNLDYTFEETILCLLSLTKNDFDKSHEYNDGMPDDAYNLRYYNQRLDQTDDLYIKFRLKNETLNINIGSFHI